MTNLELPGWREPQNFLASGEYSRIAELLHAAQRICEEADASSLAIIFAAAQQVCLANAAMRIVEAPETVSMRANHTVA